MSSVVKDQQSRTGWSTLIKAVAAELWPMCDEFWRIDHHGWGFHEIGPIAECILDIPIWYLWLD